MMTGAVREPAFRLLHADAGIMIFKEAKMARTPVIESDAAVRLVMDVRNVGLSEDQFFRLCRDNRDLRIELSAEGELIVMSPTNMETGRKNAIINGRLWNWAKRDGSGEVFDSSSELTLPNGAKRSPDASWILKTRWNRLPQQEKERFSEICPDFVIELCSPSDRLSDLQAKMAEYIENGCRLGWLLDPVERQAFIYQPGFSVQQIANPTILKGDPELPGFEFDFGEIL
jgi:Uma2 family endonuclease